MPGAPQRVPLVLVVDDYADNRELYTEYITRRGLGVIEAASGDEAVAQATLHLPDAIVMDVSLPGIDGWEATRILKADVRTRAIPVLVVTGRVSPDDATRAAAAGCHVLLTKPCPLRRLFEEVSSAMTESVSRRK